MNEYGWYSGGKKMHLRVSNCLNFMSF